MSILIIGGAFLVALLALIGLVVIVRQEVQATARTQQAAAAEKVATATTAAPVANKKITTPLQSAQHSSVAEMQTLPAAIEPALSTYKKEEQLPVVSNGQFNEFVTELHTLHEQAQEMEHRLSVLIEMVTRIERTQNSHVSIEEENFHTEDLTPITK